MDIGALASELTTALVPLLPYLLKAGEKAAEETGKAVANRDVKNSNIFTGNIQIEAPDDPVSSLHQLRAPVGDFVGREQEINTLINALRCESRACITGISGLGGIGKTELALLVAERLRDDYPDAQFFNNLQGLTLTRVRHKK